MMDMRLQKLPLEDKEAFRITCGRYEPTTRSTYGGYEATSPDLPVNDRRLPYLPIEDMRLPDLLMEDMRLRIY
jgi:hypothetical protein